MTLILLAGLGICGWILAKALEVGNISWQLEADTCVMLVVLYVLGLACACGLWRVLVSRAGMHVTWRRSLVGLGALLMGKYLPGKIFGLLGRAASVQEGTGRLRVAGVVVAEQVYALAGVAAVALIALALGSGQRLFLLGSALVLGCLSALPRLIEFLLIHVPGFAKRPVFTDWVELSRRFRKPTFGLLLLPVALAFATLATASVVPELIGLELSWQERSQLIGFYGLAVLGGAAVVVLPGGIGAREVGFVALGTSLLGAEHAIATAALLRAVTVAADVLTGIFAIALARTGLSDAAVSN